MPQSHTPSSFTHLRVASGYSLRYGASNPYQLVEQAVGEGLTSLALTDRDGLYGAIKFIDACERAGITPALGVNLAVEPLFPGGRRRRVGAAAPTRSTGEGLSARFAGEGLSARFAGEASSTRLTGEASSARFAGGASSVRAVGGTSPAWAEVLGRGGPGHRDVPESARRVPVRGGASVDPRLPRVTVLALASGAGTGLRKGQGWGRLCRLVTATHLRGERGQPISTTELVTGHAQIDGVPALTVLLGPDSEYGRAVLAGRADLALAVLEHWRSLVPPACLAVEIVHHRGPQGVTASLGHAARMLNLARQAGVPAVLTNAVRHATRDGAITVDVLDAARRLVAIDSRHLDRTTSEGYLVGDAEMTRRAHEIAEAAGDLGLAGQMLSLTASLASRCLMRDPRDELGLREAHLPEDEVLGLAGRDANTELRQRCLDRIHTVYPRASRRELARIHQRLREELELVTHLTIPTYFLTIAKVCDLIRDMGVRVAARGSGAGSLINHLLGVSGVDPLRHDLLMERFATRHRAQLPDVDLDVESDRRTDVYEKLLDVFGGDRVSCVSMMDTYRARHAIRDVGAALGLPPGEVDTIAKSFPHIRARDVRSAIAELPELRASGLGSPRLGLLFDLVERLDGLPRHIALHPCGVLISDSGLLDRTPVEASWMGFPMSQFDKEDVEVIGLLKLDVLGIRMQSAMSYAVQEIARVDGPGAVTAGNHEEVADYIDQHGLIDLDAVPHDDPATFSLIQSTRTLGCFQIESPGQRELVGKFAPETFHDLIIDISLFRPGPVKSDMVTPFLRARQHWVEPEYLHAALREVLEDTCGVVVFHEQVLKIVSIVTGCTLEDADEFRRAMGVPAMQEKNENWFRSHAARPRNDAGERVFDDADVNRIWAVLKAFASFGFCKAHAAAFALPTYQSAWLKAHHPAAFLAGVLTHDPGMYPKRLILDDARNFGIAVLPLDVNHSDGKYRVERLEAEVTGEEEQGEREDEGHGDEERGGKEDEGHGDEERGGKEDEGYGDEGRPGESSGPGAAKGAEEEGEWTVPGGWTVPDEWVAGASAQPEEVVPAKAGLSRAQSPSPVEPTPVTAASAHLVPVFEPDAAEVGTSGVLALRAGTETESRVVFGHRPDVMPVPDPAAVAGSVGSLARPGRQGGTPAGSLSFPGSLRITLPHLFADRLNPAMLPAPPLPFPESFGQTGPLDDTGTTTSLIPVALQPVPRKTPAPEPSAPEPPTPQAPAPEPVPVEHPPAPSPSKTDLVLPDGSPYGIRLSLAEVKGISEAEVQRIVANRPYQSLADFWHRAHVSRPIVERLIITGAFDSLYGLTDALPVPSRGSTTRRDLLLQLADLERWSRSLESGRARRKKDRNPPPPERFDESGGKDSSGVRRAAGLQSRSAAPVVAAEDHSVQLALDLGDAPDRIVPSGLPEMTSAERTRAELEVLGLDASRHVLEFYEPMLQALAVTRARDVRGRRSRAEILVAGVKVATQTPPIRTGRRVVFLTLDDSTGPVDATFFEDVQGPYASTVFHSWLLVVRGVLRKTGHRGVSLRATGAWELPVLWEAWVESGLEGVLEILHDDEPAGPDRTTPTRRTASTNRTADLPATTFHAGLVPADVGEATPGRVLGISRDDGALPGAGPTDWETPTGLPAGDHDGSGLPIPATRPPDPNQLRPNQSLPDQPWPDQSRPDQSRPNQSRPDQSRPDQPRPNQSWPNQSLPDQPRPDQSRPIQSRPATTPSTVDQPPATRRVLVHPSGFRQSPYADLKPPGGDTRETRRMQAAAQEARRDERRRRDEERRLQNRSAQDQQPDSRGPRTQDPAGEDEVRRRREPPRKLWHSSPGSSGR